LIYVEGREYPFLLNNIERQTLPPLVQEEIGKFLWLRDLAALGTEEARLLARSSIAGWIRQPLPQDNSVLTAARLCAIIGHFEFYARTADERFRRRLMRHLILVGRLLAIAPPELEGRWQSLVVTRGLMVVAFFLPGFKYLRERALRRLETTILQQICPDGTVRQRSPDTQFQVVRELTEMSAILRMAQQPVSDIIMTSLTRLCPVLRALRHGDGGVSLFHGGWAHDGAFVERVIQYAGRQKIVAPTMPDGRFIRLTGGKALLLADGGAPPEAGFDQTAHNAPFAFEFSYGRQRLLVNCGSSRLPSWQEALRHPSAHNSLVTEGLLPPARGGHADASAIERRISTDFVENDAGLVLELKMEVASGAGAYEWERRLSLSDDGRVLRGAESVKADADRNLVYRFHLAPDVRISDFTEGAFCELECDGMIWQFTQQGATLSLEESVYFGNGFYQKTNQIVLTANDPTERPGELPFDQLGDGRHRVVLWTLERL